MRPTTAIAKPSHFQSSNSWSAGFNESFDGGGFDGGINGSVGFGYALQAGLLLDFNLKPDIFTLTDSFDVHTALSVSNVATGTSTSIQITGEQEDNTSFKIATPADGFYLHAFAGTRNFLSQRLLYVCRLHVAQQFRPRRAQRRGLGT